MRHWLRDTPLSLRLTALYVAILATVLIVLGLVLYAQALQEAQEDTSIIDIVRTKILRFIPGL